MAHLSIFIVESSGFQSWWRHYIEAQERINQGQLNYPNATIILRFSDKS